MDLASCHPNDTWNFEVAPTLLEYLWTSGVVHMSEKPYDLYFMTQFRMVYEHNSGALLSIMNYSNQHLPTHSAG